MSKEKKKRRRAPRLLLSWSMRDQRRFIDAVEKLAALVGDFERLLLPELRRQTFRAPSTQAMAAVGTENFAGQR